ncbi:MAG: sigma-54-dependent Fis family transcriptional regulator [Gammaproteobacteria bacterium]|nr:sigma-54 dependent transcriptional regulator [Gammaproteobacteria bacterium]NNC97099.1 sigma-54-dependent Fis family transcriptional regulator [Gammaproteobacteria bacterium]NNM14111.1 sigma-54-dependent Fis family transcriptional regulator [Gammaproteobacteria bacterium]
MDEVDNTETEGSDSKNKEEYIKDKILLVGSGKHRDKLAEVLEKNNWQFDVCSTDTEFTGFIEKNHYPVVITIFTEDDSLLRSIEHHALSNFTTKWIAVVPDEEWLQRHLNMRFSQLFYDYHRLPIQESRFLDTVGHAYGMAKLSQVELENTSQHQILISDSSVDEIIGHSDVMREMRRMIKVIAEESLTVLVMGESGTGKELIARNIHLQSARHQHPFIAINCASLPESLIHSELFGNEKGAFTGADKRSIGKIEAADLGTLFLDEIGDMPMNIQVSLLRFLETRRIQRLGGVTEIDVDCRIILATNVNLEQSVAEGRFREDLYHRINVIPVNVPALRDHRADIPDLAEAFLARFNRGKTKKYFSNECMRAMQSYDWPGNVRELMNKIRRAIVVSSDKAITADDIGLDGALKANIIDLNTARQVAEKKAILEALETCGNNHTLAAESLGISRTSLYRLLGKFDDSQH